MSDNSPETTAPAPRKPKRRLLKKRFVTILAVIAVALYVLWPDPETAKTTSGTFEATRGDFDVIVLEGGSIEAKESQEIKCEVQGQTKILSIIEEGYFVTTEDVENEKILVELDSKTLLDQLTQRELEWQNAKASNTEAEEQYEIQINQNASDIKGAELVVKFAKMDFEKFLGKELAEQVIKDAGLDEKRTVEEAPVAEEDIAENLPLTGLWSVTGNLGASPLKMTLEITENDEGVSAKMWSQAFEDMQVSKETSITDGELDSTWDLIYLGVPVTVRIVAHTEGNDFIGQIRNAEEDRLMAALTGVPTDSIAEEEADSAKERAALVMASSHQPTKDMDFTVYADVKRLGDGEALQKIRQLQNQKGLAEENVKLAETKLEGTRRLHEREYVTTTTLEAEELAFQQKENNQESSDTELDLYIKYEFPKQAEKLFSDYEESLRKLDRAQRLALSKLAQSEARLNSAAARYSLQTQKRDDLKEQIEKCTIRATKPGLVVYGSNERRYWSNEQIEEGANVRERQVIITIPDTSTMVVKVSVHESYVKKVKVGQPVRIRIDAFPDELLTGTVNKIAVLPDSQSRWMNPDLKVYSTTIVVDGVFDWLKPGMSAEAEIIINELKDVLYVPLQAVNNIGKNLQVCYVKQLGGHERRVVETGEFNDSFIEILSGVEDGETVMLRKPEGVEEEEEAMAEEAAKAADAEVTAIMDKAQENKENTEEAVAGEATPEEEASEQEERPRREGRPEGRNRPRGEGRGPRNG